MSVDKSFAPLWAEDISVAHDGGAPILRHVSLRLVPGQATGLVGESGSGKSTLALALLGLLPEQLRATGAVALGDERAYPHRPDTLAAWRGRRLAYVAQDPHAALNPYFTIGRQLDEVRRIHNQERRASAQAASLAMLGRVGLTDAAAVYAAYPHTLSGGMLQRVTLAMALLAEPDVLLADEPTTALDVTLQAQIIRLLAELTRDFGMSLLLVSHDLAVCAQLTTRIVVMFAGEVVEEASTATLLRTPRHPYTYELIEAARAIDMTARPNRRELKHTAAAPDAERILSVEHEGTAPQEPNEGCAFAHRCPRATTLCRNVHPPLSALAQAVARKDAPRNYVRCFYPLERPGAGRARKASSPPLGEEP